MKALGNLTIADYRKSEIEDHLIEITGYLQNSELHEDSSGINYCKVGSLYLLSGTINFNSLILDILPEPAKTSGFIETSTGEKLLISENETTLTAPTIGTKIISGFYAIEEN